MNIENRLKKLEEKLHTKKTDDFIFLSFVDMDKTSELHSITRLNTGQSVQRESTECKSTDEFLKYVSNEWNVDVSAMFHKDNEVVEIA